MSTTVSPEFRFYYFTSRYPEVVSFYRDVLQFEIYRSWDRGTDDKGTIFFCPNRKGLIEIEAGHDAAIFNSGLYIEVDDLDEWHRRLENNDSAIVRLPCDTSYGHRNMVIEDPGGLRLTFFRYLQPRE